MKSIVRGGHVRKFVEEQQGKGPSEWRGGENVVAIGIEDGGKVIAGVVFDGFNGASVAMSTCAAAPVSEWLSREFMQACFSYAFEELGAKRIYACEAAQDRNRQEFYRLIGFEDEATLENMVPEGDVFIFKMTWQSCPFLTVPQAVRTIQ